MIRAQLPTPFWLGRLTLACLASLSLGVGCGSVPQRPNILIVVIDTLRADRVGFHRSGRSLTPFLDSLAERAVVYRNAYAPSPWTNPSVASLLTSRFQSQHGIVWFDTVLPESEETLTEVLKKHGYATAGFVANPLLRAEHGFDQGFDILRTLAVRKTPDRKLELYARAERVNEAALSWVDRVSSQSGDAPPLLLYLHYMEPHYPFRPPAVYLDEVLGGRPRPDLEMVNQALRDQDITPIDEAMLRGIRDGYDAEIMSVDAQIQALFRSLEERAFLRDAVVVVTADHGEEFLEHGYVGHHQALYEESIRVPLLIRAPGMGEPKEIETHVSLLDVAPTVLDLAGIPRPESFEGYSLRPASSGGTRAARPDVVSELVRVKIIPYKSRHERAVIGEGRKLILGLDGQREFYDLSQDPLETDPDALGDEDRAELAGRADEIRTLVSPGPAVPVTRELDPETLQHLDALGYKR